jgi:hypothetical protein
MKLKAFIFGLATLTLFTLQASAQEFHLGLEGGADFASFANSDASNFNGSRTGFVGGGFLTVGFGGFAVQPEVLYISKGGQNLNGSSTVELDYIEVPVLAKFSLGLPEINPSILIGPYFSSYAGSQTQNAILTNASNSDIGAIVGLELNIASFYLSGRYELGISHVTTDTNISNRDVTVLLGWAFI